MEEHDRVARLIATWLGCGDSPVAPGTVGSLGAVPLHFLLRRANPIVYWGVVAGITAVGVWSAQRVSDDTGVEDPQQVVIDEVAGALIAMGAVRSRSLTAQLLALVAFRVFDITKPGPVGRAEATKPAGIGIMADDVVAGALAGALVRLISRAP